MHNLCYILPLLLSIMLVSVRGAGFCELTTSEVPRDIVFILDYSGSMRNERQNLVNSVEAVIDTMSSEDRLAIFPFSSTGVNRAPVRFTNDFEAAKQRLRSYTTDGGTLAHIGFSEASNEIETAQHADPPGDGAPSADRAQFAIYFTDGQDGDSQRAKTVAISMNTNYGYKTYPVGTTAADRNEQLFEDIAKACGTEYIIGATVAEMAEVFDSIVRKNTLRNVAVVTGCVVLFAILTALLVLLVYLLFAWITGKSKLQHAPTWKYRKTLRKQYKNVGLDSEGRPVDVTKEAPQPKKHATITPGQYIRGGVSLSYSGQSGKVYFNDSTGVVPPSAPPKGKGAIHVAETTVNIDRGSTVLLSWIWYFLWDRPKALLTSCCCKNAARKKKSSQYVSI